MVTGTMEAGAEKKRRRLVGQGARAELRAVGEALFGEGQGGQTTRQAPAHPMFPGEAVLEALVVLTLDPDGRVYLSSVGEEEEIPAALVERMQVALGAGSEVEASAEQAQAGARRSASRKRKTRRS